MTTPEWKIKQNKELGDIFKQNYKKYSNILYKLRIAPDRHDDVIQQAFYHALNTSGKIDNLTSCMNAAVFNSGLYLKKNKFEKNRTFFDGVFEKFTTETPETIILIDEQKKYIRECVEKLPNRQKTAVKFGLMYNDDGENSNHVSKKMKISPNTAKALWRLGMQKLKLDKQINEMPEVNEGIYYIPNEDSDAN